MHPMNLELYFFTFKMSNSYVEELKMKDHTLMVTNARVCCYL